MTVNRYQESRKTRVLLFVSSLAPALVIAGLRVWHVHRAVSMMLLFFGGVTFALTPIVLILRRNSGIQKITVSNIKDESSQVPTYLITFVFPFLFLPEQPNGPLAVSYVTFAAFIAVLLYRTTLVLVNPAMLIVGYRIFSVDIEGQGGAHIVSKGQLRPFLPIYVKRVADGLFITTDDPHSLR